MPKTPAVNVAAGAGATPGTKEDEPGKKQRHDADTDHTCPVMSDLGAIRSLLATTTLGEFLAARHIGRPEGVPPPRDVLVLTPSCTVGEALSKLVSRRGEGGGEWSGYSCIYRGEATKQKPSSSIVLSFATKNTTTHEQPEK